MDQLSDHIAPRCHVCYEFFLNEIIFSLICTNSKPISNVINAYYETHIIILKWTEYNIGVINYYFSFLLSTESWREVKRVLCYKGILCHTLWWSPCNCVMWYVICDMWINGVWNYHQWFLSVYQTPMALLMCFSLTHASQAQWSGWNDTQCTWGNYWLSNCYTFGVQCGAGENYKEA